MNLGGAFRGQFDESDILDDVGNQTLAFATWGIGVGPELVEINRHGNQPLAHGLVETKLVALPCLLTMRTRASKLSAICHNDASKKSISCKL